MRSIFVSALMVVLFGCSLLDMNECSQCSSTFTASISSVAAIFSAICAFLAFRLSRKIQNELKSDEIIVFGPLQEPPLQHRSHRKCVVGCAVFNKSRRKAYITSVQASDDSGKEIGIKWSSSIDKVGNPENPVHLIGLVDSANLFIRRNDGLAIDEMVLKISHSFPTSPEIIEYRYEW